MQIKTFKAIRYFTPLREGGSLPAIIEGDSGQLFVVKFRGAGQGTKALIAELLAGEIARRLELDVPPIAFIELGTEIAHSEGDPEILELLNWSVGLNLGLAYLPGAFMYNPLLQPPPDAELASQIVWFDALMTNVDRTARNPNLLIWQKEMWLIDHGACLYFHHDWKDFMARSLTPFPLIRDHTLLPFATRLTQADENSKSKLDPDFIRGLVSLIPDAWLDGTPFATPDLTRQAYFDYLQSRLNSSAVFVQEAENARAQRI
ncbi:MAG: HipA family kinase [Rudaea sp.]